MEDVNYKARQGLDRKQMEDLATCHWISVLYYRIPRLAEELSIARCDGSYLKLLAKIARVDLLILDDWALSPLEGQIQHDLLEVVDDRAGSRATLVTSQLPIGKWHDVIGDPSVADALLDRLVGTSIQIVLKGGSLRKA